MFPRSGPRGYPADFFAGSKNMAGAMFSNHLGKIRLPISNFGVRFRTRFGMPFGVLFGRFWNLFGLFWEPRGHLWETVGKMDANIAHFGTRGTTTKRDVFVFIFGPCVFDSRGHFLRVRGTLFDFVMTFGHFLCKVLGFFLTS